MMTISELLLWGKMHHYPQLVLGIVGKRWDVIRAGASSWHYFSESASHARIARAANRVQQWQAYEKEVQAA